MKTLYIDVSRCVIAPQHIQYCMVDEEAMVTTILSLVTTFSATIRETVLFPFDREIWETYNPKNEEEILMPTLNFYIMDGQDNILTQKIILGTKKY